MCSRPNIINGYEVSCRECGKCMATYKNTWVARCVAQKQIYPHAYAITLTYADVDGKPPLGAKVFRYKDVSDFWKRLRARAEYKFKEPVKLSYVVVGEKGTQKGRCHYHGVVFTSHPLEEVGTFTGKVRDGYQIKRRLNWDVWGHGFVEFQEPDRKGMAYVLKYVLKGRMNAKRAEGQKHEGKTEWLSASYLWCSKIPPIGAAWLWRKIADLAAVGLCPSSLRIRVPDGGDWYVNGELQKEMCLHLKKLNDAYRQDQGVDLAGWKTLVKSVEDEIELKDTGEMVRRKPWEWLTNGEEIEDETGGSEQAQRLFDRFQAEYERQQALTTKFRRARITVANCGNVLPCESCSSGLSYAARADAQTEYNLRAEQWKERFPRKDGEATSDYKARFIDWWRTRLKVSRYCARFGLAELQQDFETLIRPERAARNATYIGSIGTAVQIPAHRNKK